MSPNLHGMNLVAQPSVHPYAIVPGPIAGPNNVHASSHGAGTAGFTFTAQHPPTNPSSGMSPTNLNGRSLATVAQPSIPYHAYASAPVPIVDPSVIGRVSSMQQHVPAVHNTNDRVMQARGSHSQMGSYL